MRERPSSTSVRLVVRSAARSAAIVAHIGLVAGGGACILPRYALTPLGSRPPRPWGSVSMFRATGVPSHSAKSVWSATASSVIGLPSLLADDGVHQLCTALHGPIIAYLTGNVRQAAPRERTVGACDETLLGGVSLRSHRQSNPEKAG